MVDLGHQPRVYQVHQPLKVNIMKKLYIVLVIVLFSISAYSQSWVSSNVLYGTSDISEIKSSSTSDGGVVSFGYFSGSSWFIWFVYPDDGPAIQGNQHQKSAGSKDHINCSFVIKRIC